MKKLFDNKEWEYVKLEDIAEYINGYPFSPREWGQTGLPIIRIQNLNNTSANFNYFKGNIDPRYIIENGDLLFSWSASLGAYIWTRGKAVLNQHIFKVVPKSGVDKFYLYYAISLAIERLEKKTHGSTMKHFKRGELKTKISLPPMHEQKRIAEILSTLDERLLLQQTQKAKLETIKKGLMNDLLTGRKMVKV